MSSVRYQALELALQLARSNLSVKEQSAEAIVANAEKFEAFLNGKRKQKLEPELLEE